MTLMAGPDRHAGSAPTKVNEAGHRQADRIGSSANLISHVAAALSPARTRRVYPGFLQLTAFMSMNAERHIKAQVDLYKADGRRRARAGR